MPATIRVQEPGGPEALQLHDAEPPRPGPGELILRQEAVGVNFLDVYLRRGELGVATPFVPGFEGAGIVDAIGEGVQGFAPGDRVAYPLSRGAYGARRRIAAASVVPVPDAIDLRVAASVMLQGLTAHYLVHDVGRLGPDERVLVHAAAGGVGSLLVQLATRRGAEVIGTVGSAEKAERIHELGAAHAIRYRDEDFVERVLEITEGRGVDVVYDGVGAATFVRGLDTLRPRGHAVLFGWASGRVPPFDLHRLNARSLTVSHPSLGAYVGDRDWLERASADLFAAIAGGELRAAPTDALPLEAAAEAHRRLEARDTTGSLVLLP